MNRHLKVKRLSSWLWNVLPSFHYSDKILMESSEIRPSGISDRANFSKTPATEPLTSGIQKFHYSHSKKLSRLSTAFSKLSFDASKFSVLLSTLSKVFFQFSRWSVRQEIFLISHAYKKVFSHILVEQTARNFWKQKWHFMEILLCKNKNRGWVKLKSSLIRCINGFLTLIFFGCFKSLFAIERIKI